MNTFAQERRLVERFYSELWNAHDFSNIMQILSPHFTFRGSLGQSKTGHAGFIEYVNFVHTALGQYHCAIEEIVIEPPKAFAKMQFSGVHQNTFFDYPATGKPIAWAGAALFSFKDNTITDLWVLGDLQQLLTQLASNANAAKATT